MIHQLLCWWNSNKNFPEDFWCSLPNPTDENRGKLIQWRWLGDRWRSNQDQLDTFTFSCLLQRIPHSWFLLSVVKTLVETTTVLEIEPYTTNGIGQCEEKVPYLWLLFRQGEVSCFTKRVPKTAVSLPEIRWSCYYYKVERH